MDINVPVVVLRIKRERACNISVSGFQIDFTTFIEDTSSVRQIVTRENAECLHPFCIALTIDWAFNSRKTNRKYIFCGY